MLDVDLHRSSVDKLGEHSSAETISAVQQQLITLTKEFSSLNFLIREVLLAQLFLFMLFFILVHSCGCLLHFPFSPLSLKQSRPGQQQPQQQSCNCATSCVSAFTLMVIVAFQIAIYIGYSMYKYALRNLFCIRTT